MSGRGGLGLAAALALAAWVPVAAASVRESESLAVEAPSWVVAGRPATLRVRPAGPLAIRRITVDLFVDGDRAAELVVDRGPALHELDTSALSPGRHAILAKCGSERTQVEILVVPAWSPWAVAAAFAAAVVAGVAIRRRRTGKSD